MPRPLPKKEDFEPYFEGLKYKFDDSEKFSTRINVIITCSEGHEYKHNIGKVRRGDVNPYICPFCEKEKKYNKQRLSYEVLNSIIDKTKFSIVNKQKYYNTTNDTVKLKCKQCNNINEIKNIYYAKKNNTFGKQKCSKCRNEYVFTKNYIKDRIKKIKNNDIRNEFELEKEMDLNDIPNNSFKEKYLKQNDWNILSYKNTKTKCWFQCVKCGYKKETYPHNLFITGNNCNQCKNLKIRDNILEDIRLVCEQNEIFPEKDEFYNGSHEDIDMICGKCGGKFSKKWKDKSYGFHCPHCKKPRSRSENSFADEIKALTEYEVIRNDRGVISPLELDVHIPHLKLAFEYCGNIWHSSKFVKDNMRHRDKYKLCLKKGIRLITIFEDEWLKNKKICLSRIKNVLGEVENKIFARKCRVERIDNSAALKFCRENHIQGRGHANISYGLFFDKEIVSVMTFTKPSVSKNGKDYDWELNRFCSKKDCIVVGGASKLLKQFRKEHIGEKLITFCDMRWGTGNVYEKLGFGFDKETRPNYYYIGEVTKWERKHRFNFTKQKLIDMFDEDSSLTEFEIAEKHGLYRIYDCGHKKYEMTC
jgi:hypothetical protein